MTVVVHTQKCANSLAVRNIQLLKRFSQKLIKNLWQLTNLMFVHTPYYKTCEGHFSSFVHLCWTDQWHQKTSFQEKAKHIFLFTTKMQLASCLLFCDDINVPSHEHNVLKDFYWQVITHSRSKWLWIKFKFVARATDCKNKHKKQFAWYV